MDLCYDARLFIFNGRTPGDKLGEFTYLANGGHNIVDYIVGSLVVWQLATHFEVIIDDIHYYVVEGNFYHRPLHLQLNIDCSFVKPQHMVETKFFLPRFKYDKSKVEKYQLALIASLGNLWVGNLWVANLIGHWG